MQLVKRRGSKSNYSGIITAVVLQTLVRVHAHTYTHTCHVKGVMSDTHFHILAVITWCCLIGTCTWLWLCLCWSHWKTGLKGIFCWRATLQSYERAKMGRKSFASVWWRKIQIHNPPEPGAWHPCRQLMKMLPSARLGLDPLLCRTFPPQAALGFSLKLHLVHLVRRRSSQGRDQTRRSDSRLSSRRVGIPYRWPACSHHNIPLYWKSPKISVT